MTFLGSSSAGKSGAAAAGTSGGRVGATGRGSGSGGFAAGATGASRIREIGGRIAVLFLGSPAVRLVGFFSSINETVSTSRRGVTGFGVAATDCGGDAFAGGTCERT